MKAKDIKVGEEYAVEVVRDARYPRRARVIEVGVERKGKPQGRSWVAQRYNDGIRVVVLDNETGEPAANQSIPRADGGNVVRAVDLHMTWQQWLDREARLDAQAEADRERRRGEAQRRKSALDSLIPPDFNTFWLPYGLKPEDRGNDARVIIQTDVLIQLLQAVRDQAKAERGEP